MLLDSLMLWSWALLASLTTRFILALPEAEGWPETHAELMSKRTFFESPYPIPCATACMYIDIVWGGCSTMQYTWACEMHCSPFNYTRGVQCLECRVANGDPAMNRDQAQMELSEWNEACEGVTPREDQNGNSNWTATSSITAEPTTTGPFSTSVEGNEAIPISVWTGLTAYITDSVFPAIPSGAGIGAATSEPSGGVWGDGSQSPTASETATAAESSPNGVSHGYHAMGPLMAFCTFWAFFSSIFS